MAIDLGTTTTRIYVKGKGILCNEPSVVAIGKNFRGEKKIVAVGTEAKEMVGKTPDSIAIIKPMKDGVIADFEITSSMLKHFIKKVHNNRKTLIKPRIVICVPFGITEVEKKAVKESAIVAGAREVYLIEEPMAAAIGAGLPVTEPVGNMIVAIGGGTTEVAVIALSGIVISKSIRVGGNKMDEAIIHHVKIKHNLLIGERTAEILKIHIGSAFPDVTDNQLIQVKGRDLVAGIPKTVEITSKEIEEALSDSIRQIVEAVKFTLEKTPPELAADLIEKGIIIAGGGALLKNIDILLREATGLPVSRTEDPLCTVITGGGAILDDNELLEKVTIPV